MMYILAAILIFGVLVAVHEGGHFLAARLCGVTVHEFAIGMGPILWKKEPEEGTEGTRYSLRLLPIGGFCALEGEEEASDNPHALNNQGIFKQIFIFAAGAAMNFLVSTPTRRPFAQRRLPASIPTAPFRGLMGFRWGM